jgi:hypothetical protein
MPEGKAVLTLEEIAARDPFSGRGLALDIPSGLNVTMADVWEVTGSRAVVLFPHVIWVELAGPEATGGYDQAREEVRGRWDQWVAGDRTLASRLPASCRPYSLSWVRPDGTG